MIYLTKPNEPTELTDNKAMLIGEFLLNKKDVWNKPYIRGTLLECSFGKCCYCECKINEESKYLEVEHFKHKDQYPNNVVDWDNLLPSCKKCNVTKGIHDVIAYPIIDPFRIDPKVHLGFKEYRLKHKTTLGKDTVDILDLNNTERLVKLRFKIGEGIKNQLELCIESLISYRSNATTQRKNKIIRTISNLLFEACPNSEYSATAATILLNESDYYTIKEELMTLALWDQSIQNLENQARAISLDKI